MMFFDDLKNFFDTEKEIRKANLRQKADDDIRALREHSYNLRKQYDKEAPETFEEYEALSEKEFQEAVGKSYNTPKKKKEDKESGDESDSSSLSEEDLETFKKIVQTAFESMNVNTTMLKEAAPDIMEAFKIKAAEQEKSDNLDMTSWIIQETGAREVTLQTNTLVLIYKDNGYKSFFVDNGAFLGGRKYRIKGTTDSGKTCFIPFDMEHKSLIALILKDKTLPDHEVEDQQTINGKIVKAMQDIPFGRDMDIYTVFDFTATPRIDDMPEDEIEALGFSLNVIMSDSLARLRKFKPDATYRECPRMRFVNANAWNDFEVVSDEFVYSPKELEEPSNIVLPGVKYVVSQKHITYYFNDVSELVYTFDPATTTAIVAPAPSAEKKPVTQPKPVPVVKTEQDGKKKKK